MTKHMKSAVAAAGDIPLVTSGDDVAYRQTGAGV